MLNGKIKSPPTEAKMVSLGDFEGGKAQLTFDLVNGTRHTLILTQDELRFIAAMAQAKIVALQTDLERK